MSTRFFVNNKSIIRNHLGLSPEDDDEPFLMKQRTDLGAIEGELLQESLVKIFSVRSQ